MFFAEVDWVAIVGMVLEHLPTLVMVLVPLVVGLVVKDEKAKADAVASIKTAVEDLWRDGHPVIVAAMADGKITAEEWGQIAKAMGPRALGVATKGGAKVLRGWFESDSVAAKYTREAISGIAASLPAKPVEPE